MKLLLKVSGIGVEDFLEAEEYSLHHSSVCSLLLREKKVLPPPGSIIGLGSKETIQCINLMRQSNVQDWGVNVIRKKKDDWFTFCWSSQKCAKFFWTRC